MMVFNNVKRLILVMLSLTLFSCSSPTTDVNDITIADLSGLWDSSEKTGNETDLIYTRISGNGDIIEYDFDGDDVDQGLSCYQVNTGTIKRIKDNRFLVVADMYKETQFDVELEILDAGHALKIYFMDGTTTLRSQIWTRVPDQSLLDKEPTCQSE